MVSISEVTPLNNFSGVTPLYLTDSDTGTDSDPETLSFTESNKEEFQREIANMEKKVSILCCGPIRVGKSTLLNGLMGQGESEWHNEPKFVTCSSLKGSSCEMTKKTFQRDGIEVTVWDTPGLSGSVHDENTLQEIKMKCAEFDLFLYCIDSMEKRGTDLFDEKSTLHKFTELFGAKKLWKNAVVVLTKANGLVEDIAERIEAGEDINVEEEFKKKISMWEKKIHKEIIKLGYKKAAKVPVVPAGSSVNPSLPGYPHWLGKIFEKATDRMKYKAKLAYLRLSNDRLKNHDEVGEEDLSNMPIHTQPFVVSTKYKIAAILGISGAGAGSAAVGASIGATIGALALGIPSFGVFAAGGLALGGAIGAGLGFTVSAATALAVRYYLKKKHRE